MSKGVVADICGKKAVVLLDNGEFLTIINKNYTVGQQIICKKMSYRQFASIAACIALFFILGYGGIKMYYTPISYIDIDINPSIRFEINRFDKVINVIPLNDDAQELLNGVPKISGDIRSCVEKVIEQSEKEGYLNQNNKDVDIYVTSGTKKILESIYRCCDAYSEVENINVTVNKNEYDDYKKAKELDVSVGKYKSIQEYTEQCGGTMEENVHLLDDKTNHEIQKMTDVVHEVTTDEIVAQPEISIPDVHESTSQENNKKYDEKITQNEEDYKETNKSTPSSTITSEIKETELPEEEIVKEWENEIIQKPLPQEENSKSETIESPQKESSNQLPEKTDEYSNSKLDKKSNEKSENKPGAQKKQPSDVKEQTEAEIYDGSKWQEEMVTESKKEHLSDERNSAEYLKEFSNYKGYGKHNRLNKK